MNYLIPTDVAYLCWNNWTHNGNQMKTPKSDGNGNLSRQGKGQKEEGPTEQCSSNFVNQEVDKGFVCIWFNVWYLYHLYLYSYL